MKYWKCSKVYMFVRTFPILAWRLHFAFVLISFILLNLFDFYFATRVHFIEDCSILIQCKLISPLENADDVTIVLMKEASSDVWYLSELLNERFAYTLLVSVASKLTIFVIDIYWLYLRMFYFTIDFDFFRMLCSYKSVVTVWYPFISFSSIHSLLASFDFPHWSFLLLQFCIEWIQKYYILSPQVIKQQIAHPRYVKTAGRLFTAINEHGIELYSDGVFRDLKNDATWCKNNQDPNEILNLFY